jgi:hypothetical protein
VEQAEYVAIEKGRLIAPDEGVERAWFPLDEIELKIEDAGGEVSITGNLYLDEPPAAGRAEFVVVCRHSGRKQDRLGMALSLFDFRSGQYVETGKTTISGSKDEIARFSSPVRWNDSRIGDRLNIRFQLAVRSNSDGPGSHYVLSIKAVSLRLR